MVHGGGPQIGAMLKRLGIKSEFAAGLRVTDAATIEVVEMVLAGSINKQIVGFINAAGGKAVGLCGKDGNMVQARKVRRAPCVDPGSNIEKVVDLGFVGEPEQVDRTVLDQILGRDLIPVLAPVATSARRRHLQRQRRHLRRRHRRRAQGQAPAAADRRARRARQVEEADHRAHASTRRAALIADGTISGGMIPKVETCIYALEQGVEGVVILDGKVPHAVLLELFTDHGAGTLMPPVMCRCGTACLSRAPRTERPASFIMHERAGLTLASEPAGSGRSDRACWRGFRWRWR